MSFEGSQGTLQTKYCRGIKVVEKKRMFVDYSTELEADCLKMVNRMIRLPNFATVIPQPANTKRKNRIFIRKIDGCGLQEYLTNAKIPPVAKLSCIYRLLAIVHIMNERTGICHGDLHTDNIIVKQTSDRVHEYRIDDQLFSFKTYGVSPVLIDFGLAYNPIGRARMVWDFTGIGYFPFESDCLQDARILTNRCARAFNNSKHPVLVEFTRVVKEFWRPLNLDRGWFQKGTFDSVLEWLKDILYTDAAIADVTDRLDENGVIFNLSSDALDFTLNIILSQLPSRQDIYADPYIVDVVRRTLDSVSTIHRCGRYVDVGDDDSDSDDSDDRDDSDRRSSSSYKTVSDSDEEYDEEYAEESESPVAESCCHEYKSSRYHTDPIFSARLAKCRTVYLSLVTHLPARFPTTVGGADEHQQLEILKSIFDGDNSLYYDNVDFTEATLKELIHAVNDIVVYKALEMSMSKTKKYTSLFSHTCGDSRNNITVLKHILNASPLLNVNLTATTRQYAGCNGKVATYSMTDNSRVLGNI